MQSRQFRQRISDRWLRIAGLVALAVLFTAGGLQAQEMASEGQGYEVTVTNLTENQVLSPPILITHDPEHSVWQAGQPASEGIRAVAETGMTGPLAEAYRDTATAIATLAGPIPPGESASVSIEAASGDVLSAATMLVQTNDGFTGLHGLELTGNTSTRQTDAYDAGTETNTELSSDVPGPPFGGMNRNPTNPPEPIAMHAGIAGDADVGSEYDWDGPVAEFTIRPMPQTLPATGTGPDPVSGHSWQVVVMLLAALTIVGLAVTTLRREQIHQPTSDQGATS